jgi:hypothetical protein
MLVHHSSSLRSVFFAVGLGGLLSLATGCGALSAAANPKVAWAINDPAPMSVVVRRADVAAGTGKEVDRLMTETPVAVDSSWLKQTAPAPEAAKKHVEAMRAHEIYQANQARVVEAEVWSKTLSGVGEAAPPPVAKAEAAPASKEPPKAKGANKDSRATAVTKGAAKAAGAAPAKVEAKASKAEALGTDAPKPDVSKAASSPSVLAAIDAGLGAEYAKIMAKKKELGAVRADIALAEAQMDEKGADKAALKAKVKELEAKVDPAEKEINELTKAFAPKANEAAKKTAPELRAALGPMLVNLKQAVEDANTANSAAVVRYPLAARSLPDSAKSMAMVYVADIIEEQTGKRPTLTGLTPGVKLDGGDVQITLNGLSASDLGKLSVGDVTKETAKRTGVWVKHALGLLGSISATKDVLTFEGDVIQALIDGFSAAGFAPPAAPTVPVT